MRTRRRLTLVLAAAILSAGLASAPLAGAASGARSPVHVGHLTVDNTVDPLGTDDRTPTLGWQLTSARPDEMQSGYHVLVASAPDKLTPAAADVWDSGPVASAASVGVAYGGPALQAAHRYYWAVQVTDSRGRAGAWSAPAWWETGLLSTADWQGAQWISPDTGDTDSWSDFTLDLDMTLKTGAAGIVFRAADSNNFSMWQINAVNTPGEIRLRPHIKVNGGYTTLPETNLAPVLTPANIHEQHHVRITAAGDTITLWIDGTQVDQRTDPGPAKGTIGFRSSTSNGVAEDTLFDNLAVHAPDGTSLFADDFSTTPDPSFPGVGITDGQLEPLSDPVLLDPNPAAPMLRDGFDVHGTVASARAYVYGLGFYELHLNGHKVGDHVLAPSNSVYTQRNLYDTYDVTGELHQGANAVGMWLGNGYDSSFSQFGFRWTGPKQAIVALQITYADGSHQTVTSNDGWRWSTGPIVADGIYAGETYDARKEQSGWDSAGFDDSSWQPVHTVAAPSDDLTAATLPPNRVVRTWHPVQLTNPQPGVWIYDLGQNISGWARLRVSGPAGTAVRLRTAEELGADGMLDTVTNRNAASTDTYILSGARKHQTYEPRFTYHGFRYVEVTGFPGRPTLADLDGREVHADLASTGSFTSSDSLLNQIWTMNRQTILNNSMSTPTDNPVRDERTPPGMDVQAYRDASTREFGMDAFYAKYLVDLPPGTALPSDDARKLQPDMYGAAITLAWTVYQQYGDKAALAGSYPAMAAQVDADAAHVPDHIWPESQGFGDWCPPDTGSDANGGRGGPNAGSCFSEVSVVNTALSYVQAQDTAQAAAVLGHADDADHFTAVAAAIKDAFNAKFLDASTGVYGDGRQVTSILPLAFGMVPAGDLAAVGAHLVDRIQHTDNGHLDTGIFGTRYLLDALSAIGRTDVAMSVLDQKTYPGFGYEISQGATTDWEEWLYASAMESHDHAMFAGINASMYTQLAGITPTSPAYATIDVAPELPGSLHHVAATQATVRGPVAVSWTEGAHRVSLSVRIPVNATATVHVPLAGSDAADVRGPAGARFVRSDADTAVYTVGSGRWDFTVRR